jgi:hypothetical protein
MTTNPRILDGTTMNADKVDERISAVCWQISPGDETLP